MRTWGAALAAVFLACSSADEPEAAPPRPVACDPATQRIGTYLMHMDAISGNCPAVPDSLVSFGPTSTGQNDGCKRLQDDRLSEGNCKIERQVECVNVYDDPTVYGGKAKSTVSTTGISTQITADGAMLEGTATISISGDSGACLGTYKVTWKRQ